MLRQIFFCVALCAGSLAWAVDDLAEALRHYDAGRYDRAAELLPRLAAAGDAVAQHRLAVMYFYGHGVAENENLALEWSGRSAEQGNLDAMYFLANIYLFGDDVPNRAGDADREAAKWYFGAAVNGHVDAEYGMGLMFLAGKGVAQDQDEAMKWLRRAATHGHPGARSFFGMNDPASPARAGSPMN